MIRFWRTCMLILITAFFFQSCKNDILENWKWETITTQNEPIKRHEAGFVSYRSKLYLLGGRGIHPTSEFDVISSTWKSKSKPPIELHHFQPVVLDSAIYIVGAMTGKWPTEEPLDKVIIYYPDRDEYVFSHSIPKHRRRGGAGVVVYNNKIYVVGGITHGHNNGYKPWFDEYDPKTGQWTVLDNAPNARDHFQAAVVNDKLYAFGGRTTSKKTDQDMELTVAHGNIYDFQNNKWEVVKNNTAIPTERAGSFVFTWNNDIVIGGGESVKQVSAHNEVEAYNSKTNTWSKWPSFNQGRHGTGFAIIKDYVYTASGCANRGGSPELTTIERLKLPRQHAANSITEFVDSTFVHKQWHTVTLGIEGPETSESDKDNPFLNYRLEVEFYNEEFSQKVYGFYAADGNSAETSASKGNIWKVRFKPDKLGDWSYSASLYKGDSIALKPSSGKSELINSKKGRFIVVRSDKEGDDFRGKGILEASSGYFKFRGTNNYWLKVGANSPENLLAYKDFDDSYRIVAESREWEAVAPDSIHAYAAHLNDWKTGDPSWKKGKGKALIGAINYLSSKGMNAAYFITMNILGDGKDVWPYVSPDDFTRFDVSKLEQWDIVFDHMESKGMLMHLVIQETENETLLDGGDTGPMRQLYLRELIARFGHHLGLVWNLGEENGPAYWSPKGQNDKQRKAMAKFLKDTDPYNHPVVLHTHAEDPLREDILNDILDCKDLDGLSLQQSERKEASLIVDKWRKKSKKNGNDWLITMDEIGLWHTGALLDSEDTIHNSLRQYVLWGTLLSGAAGVEWYFGGKHPHNDLTSEDWRERNNLWEITNHAKTFFNKYIPYWEMEPKHTLINAKEGYCLRKKDEVYVVYIPKTNSYTIDLSETKGDFIVMWYNPVYGGDLQTGTIKTIRGGETSSLGLPIRSSGQNLNKDWVVLIEKQ
ncbi:DUF5060 domain-containing protein [uncultured Algibacter sp.]|uniref:Kelch repeat-containing protein n=1 Tax=uncultured Algibacter sp. TaxID=298659 RepID=UPI002621F7ED|nr:DUF5060 domain-containing protein [uncultured Algibacter sp.]